MPADDPHDAEEIRDDRHQGHGPAAALIRSANLLFVAIGTLVALCAAPEIRAGGFDRIALNVSDPAAAAEWYAKHLGGRLTKVDAAPAVAFGKITLTFAKAKLPTGESIGSGFHHLGFSYDNLDAAMQRFARSGVRIVSGIEKDGPIRYAFIHDPWSTLIEVVEDPEIHGFHHIHLATQNPKATLKWYTDVFGGKVSRFAGLIGGIREGDTWILVKGVDHPLKPTAGWAIDHVSWPVARFDEAVKRLEAKGALFESPSADARGRRSVFVEGPDGVRLELVRTAE
jgi:catechol 2,3-dioxygenase-like lactoylglutathione lyase family enzyme